MVRLGFTPGFAATWVHTGNPPGTIQALVVGLCLLRAAVAMIATLFRILDDGSPLDQLSLVATPETSFVVITKDGRLHKNLPEAQ